VITEPTNLYDQKDFMSRDVALTFHIGLMLRVSYREERMVPVAPGSAYLLPGSWRRWQQAFEAYDADDEAEHYQSVAVRLRECLVSFVGETDPTDIVPEGETPPKAQTSKHGLNSCPTGWPVAIVRRGCGPTSRKSPSKCGTINWLTHAKNGTRIDAEIGLKAVEHLLGMFTAARLRDTHTEVRCQTCGSYRVGCYTSTGASCSGSCAGSA
jgi:hypothetical protein